MIRGFIALVVLLYTVLPVLVNRKIPLFFQLLVGGVVMSIIPVNMSLRPMIVTSLGLGFQHVILNAYRQGRLSLKGVLPLLGVIYLLWGNMHTGVVFGLTALALMTAGDLLERLGIYRFSPVHPEVEGRPLGMHIYAVLGVVCFLASIVNPYGVGIYQYLSDLSGQQYLNDVIVELQSPNFHFVTYQFFAAMFCVFILLMHRTHRVFAARDVFLLLFFTAAMLGVQRVVVWTCLLYVLILPKALYQCWSEIRLEKSFLEGPVLEFEKYRPVLMGALAVFLAGFLFLAPSFPQVVPRALHGRCTTLFKGINAYEKLKLPTDRLMNDPEIGSCALLYYPAQKVFIDSRFDFYQGRFMQAQRDTAMLFGDWHPLMEKWQINTVMLLAGKPMVRLLSELPDYQLLYRDKAVVIFRKTDMTQRMSASKQNDTPAAE